MRTKAGLLLVVGLCGLTGCNTTLPDWANPGTWGGGTNAVPDAGTVTTTTTTTTTQYHGPVFFAIITTPDVADAGITADACGYGPPAVWP